MIENINILNPKRSPKENSRTNWFSYYAGFSPDFVLNVINSIIKEPHTCIADPWNGGGTTTTIANALGFESKGVDLNPVMIVAAKACLLNSLEIPSISPLTNDIIKKTPYIKSKLSDTDPLNNWLTIEGTQQFRCLEGAIKKLLIEPQYHNLIKTLEEGGTGLSSLTCFFYIGLFRVLRNTIKPFQSSNPTWIKTAKSHADRININKKYLLTAFKNEISIMTQEMKHDALYNGVTNARTDFSVANSELLPWETESIDLIITSPPYCTRIDYAVATMPELAILGSGTETGYTELRRKLIGTTTVPEIDIEVNNKWGETCISFLNNVYDHESKASRSYYFKSHTQYFKSIYNSIAEIKRVLKKDGKCITVLQDSFYKNIHNDLATIFSEMTLSHNLSVVRKEDFPSIRTMSGINPQVKKYRNTTEATESVILLQKQ